MRTILLSKYGEVSKITNQIFAKSMLLRSKRFCSIEEQRTIATRAARLAIDRAIFLRVAESDKKLWIREILPHIDLPKTFSTEKRWVFPSSTVAITEIGSTITWINERISRYAVSVFYGIAFETDNPEISMISLGQYSFDGEAFLKAEYCFETFRNQGDTLAYFSDPIIFDPYCNIFVTVINRLPIPAAGIFIRLLGFAIEPDTKFVK